MANMCYSNLIVSGPLDQIDAFMAACNSYLCISDPEDTMRYFTLNKLVPIPEEYAETEFQAQWRMDNWGTRSDVGNDVTIFYPRRMDFVSISFFTAWSPPSVWVQRVARQFPGLNFILKYHELGSLFAGTVEARGATTSEYRADYDNRPNDFFLVMFEEFGMTPQDIFGEDYEEDDYDE